MRRKKTLPLFHISKGVTFTQTIIALTKFLPLKDENN